MLGRGRSVALNSRVQVQVAPIGLEDDWIDILNEPGDVVNNRGHDLMNESFEPGSRGQLAFREAVDQAREEGTLARLTCDTHIWFAPACWVQRNGAVVR